MSCVLFIYYPYFPKNILHILLLQSNINYVLYCSKTRYVSVMCHMCKYAIINCDSEIVYDMYRNI